jgi:prevent-host-death family protein
MINVGIREFKAHLSRYLACVREGETLVITDRGKPVARLERMPATELEPPPLIKRLVAAGRLIDKGPPPRDLPAPIPLLPGDGGKTSADYVREQRR